MVGKEVFLMKPKHKKHLSQWAECDYCAHDEKDGNYYLNPCLPQLKGQFKSEKW